MANPLKALGVIGGRSAFWYAVYRLEILGGISRRRTPVGDWDSIVSRLPEAYTAWNPDSQPPFFFDDPRSRRKTLRRISPHAADSLKKEINEVGKGFFRLWEDGRYECGFLPEWNRNPLTGSRRNADRHWTDEDERSGGDVKGVWELSRFAVAFRLARWYAFSGEERAAEMFWRLAESWLSANPPNAGPQWFSAQEAALRAMAWVFALRAFARSPATTSERAGKLIAGLDAHASRMDATLAYARAQNNNHLISEAAGLFTIGLMFPHLPRAVRWREKGRRLLLETAPQFFPDGGYIQHSHNYHRLALHLYLWVLRLAEINGQPLPEDVYRCVDRSIPMLDRMVDPQTGLVPNFGHNDGALFLPLNVCGYEDYRPLLQTLTIWRRKERPYPDGPWNEDAVWMLGPDALRGTGRASQPRRKSEPASFAAPSAGLFVLRGKDSRAVIRCARFHERPAHADQLHVDLWWRGENIAADAGSYLYSGDEPWQNALTHAGIHNTVTVDGIDQMRRGGRFLWTDLAQATGEFSGEGVWQGTHDGYRGLGIIHRRVVEPAKDGSWIVIDDLLGEGRHAARLHWLIPDYPLIWIAPKDSKFQNILSKRIADWKDGSGAGLILRTAAGDISLRVWSSRKASWSLCRAGELLRGEEERRGPVPREIRGWRSLYYANKIPALSLAGTADGVLPIRFVSVWAPLSRRK